MYVYIMYVFFSNQLNINKLTNFNKIVLLELGVFEL